MEKQRFKYPTYSQILIFLGILTAIYAIHKGYGLKGNTKGDFEASPTIKKDTMALEPPIITSTQNTVIPQFVPKQKTKPTVIKKGDTLVVLQEPAKNINLGENNGIIGDNNSNININQKPRLPENLKPKIIDRVNKLFSENGKDKGTCINVFTPSNNLNPDSKYLVEDIEQFLILNGYNVQHSIMMYADNYKYTSPITIGFREPMPCLQIVVWLN